MGPSIQIERSSNSRAGGEALDGQREWFLVHVKVGRELVARTNLERQGYVTFMPLERRTVRHARRVTQALAAYFPGYIFVQADRARQSLRPVNSTVGVLRLVAGPDGPKLAPIKLIELLKASCDAQGVLRLAGEAWNPGDAVRVVHGPFIDQEGLVEGLCGTDRVKMLLRVMNANVRLTVPTESLRKAG